MLQTKSSVTKSQLCLEYFNNKIICFCELNLPVSVMAFEEFSVLQTKLEVESQCRAEAEKLASEVSYSIY